MSTEHAEAITKLELFEGFTAQGAQMLLDKGEVHEYESGKLLIREGDPSTFVLLLLSGKVTVFVERGRRELVLTEMGPGSIIGDVGILCGIPRAASVRTMEPSTILTWSDAAFRSILLRNVFLSERLFARLLRGLIENERSLIDSLVKAGG